MLVAPRDVAIKMKEKSLNNIDASILMAVYKNDNPVLFEKAMTSIFANSLIPNEIVLVIDGKINFELENVVNQFNEKYNLKIVRNKENLGLDKSLNIGLKYVKNEIIFRCDSDDVNKSNRFEEQFDYLSENTEVSVIGAQIDEFDEFDQYSGSRCVPTTMEGILKYARYRNPMNHQTVAMRKSAVIAVGGYPENTVYKEDYILWVRMLGCGLVIKNLSHSLVDVSAGDSLMNRRGGLKYAFGEITVQKELVAARISPIYLALFVFILKFSLYLTPTRILSTFYKKFLRTKRYIS